VPVRVATLAGIGLLLGSVALAVAIRPALAWTVAAYVALTTAYSIWLKHIAVVDVVTVSAGFVLRAIAGAAATGVPISEWFFIVASFGSLFMVSGKRGAEAAELDTELALEIRGALLAYCLWAFERAELTDEPFPWYQVSIIPFALGLFRYALVLEQGRGAAPEEVILSDRVLQLVGAAWAVVFAFGVYTS
jgi:decaprenyl-phosphate phosphoribosyltransferase